MMSGDEDSPNLPPEWRKNLPLADALRAHYKDVLNEPVPEKLKELIKALREKERQASEKDESE
ncbi:MAG: NepR family anti-sigma factor [Pseudomonadota bacterium]